MRGVLYRWHMRLAWVAGIAALLWGMTGLSHPLMVWNSPRPAAFAPPSGPFDLAGVMSAGTIMGLHDIAKASLVRAVRAENSPRVLWLIREDDSSQARYFDSLSGLEVTGEDQRRAGTLARHFAGDRESPIKSADYLTAFTPDYPEVNRLLPVWRISFDRPDGLVAYVDTGHLRLATLSNDIRRVMLWTFTNIHTLAFLPQSVEPVRVLIVLLMVGSLWAAAILAFGLLVAMRGNRRGARRWHRLLGYVAVIPALMFTSSGLYHLLHGASSGASSPAFSAMAQRSQIDAMTLASLPPAPEAPIAALLAIGHADGAVWRLTIVPDRGEKAAPTEAADDPHAHHAPAPPGGKALAQSGDIWIDAASGAVSDDGPNKLIRAIALSSGRSDIAGIARIDSFTDEYGFINKRLPVWRIAFADETASRLFIDPVEGMIAGIADDSDLLEGQVFNLLHKWRWLDGIGSKNRDIVIMSFVALILIMTLLGWRLRLRRRA